MSESIAVLLTCHNRKEKTLKCLEALYACKIPEEFNIEVYLVDDGSIDGTGEVVRAQFPEVNVIDGDGSLYWNRGMRLAWKTAAETKDHDFYLWLNDDTFLDENALVELLSCYKKEKKEAGNYSIITGACRARNENTFTYGGRNEDGPVRPNGDLQSCTYINGNVVLVPEEIFNTIGNLSSDYTHAMGDIDYGLRALKHDFKCYTTRIYIAVCESTEKSEWSNPNTPFLKRLKLLYSPKGLCISEYLKFRKKFWKREWILYAVKAYLKVLFPKLYNKLSNMNIKNFFS